MVISTIGMPPRATASAAKSASATECTRIAGTISNTLDQGADFFFFIPEVYHLRDESVTLPCRSLERLASQLLCGLRHSGRITKAQDRNQQIAVFPIDHKHLCARVRKVQQHRRRAQPRGVLWISIQETCSSGSIRTLPWGLKRHWNVPAGW